MSTRPTGPIAADRSAGDTAALVPTATAATPPVDPATTDPVTAREIAEFLRHLTRFRSPAAGGDPADHAALLARKTELFARIADQHARSTTGAPSAATPATPATPEGRTP